MLNRPISALALALGALLLFPATPAPAASPHIDVVVPLFKYPDGKPVTTVAQAISNSGTVIGYAQRPLNGRTFSFERFASGRFSPRFQYPDVSITFASGINTAGIVCGTIVFDGEHGFFFDGNSFTLFTIRGAFDTIVEGINDAGDFVGYSFDDLSKVTPFVSIAGNVTTFTIPGVNIVYAESINNLGQIVGTYVDPANTTITHGFLRNADGTLVYPLDFPGAHITALHGINDSGIIAGSTQDSNQTYHGVVLHPPDLYLAFDYSPNSNLTAFTGINNAGEITGMSVGPDGSFVAQLVQ